MVDEDAAGDGDGEKGTCRMSSLVEVLHTYARIRFPSQRDDAEFGEALDEDAAGDADGEKGAAAGGSGLPWDGDDKRDYKYEELLGEFQILWGVRSSSACLQFTAFSLRLDWGCAAEAVYLWTTSHVRQ